MDTKLLLAEWFSYSYWVAGSTAASQSETMIANFNTEFYTDAPSVGSAGVAGSTAASQSETMIANFNTEFYTDAPSVGSAVCPFRALSWLLNIMRF